MNVILSKPCDFMKLHLNHISIQMLTKEFHFHEDYFNRLLKSQTGMTYTEYLQMLRLEKAEQLLTDDNTIEQIAEKVEFIATKDIFIRSLLKEEAVHRQYRRKRQKALKGFPVFLEISF